MSEFKIDAEKYPALAYSMGGLKLSDFLRLAKLYDATERPMPGIIEREFQALVAEVREETIRGLCKVDVWTTEETEGMADAYERGKKRHGYYETLYAVGAWLLRHRAKKASVE